MNAQKLRDTATALVADDKGLPAMDESNPTCNKRFAKLEIPQTAEARRAWREMIVTTPCLAQSISGAILYDETAELASTRLNAMNVRFKSRLPWALAFSFARAIQQPALEIWQGKDAHVSAAQQALNHRAKCNRAARRGEFNPAMESTPQVARPAA